MKLAYQQDKDQELFPEVEACYKQLKALTEDFMGGRFKYYFQEKEEKKASGSYSSMDIHEQAEEDAYWEEQDAKEEEEEQEAHDLKGQKAS